MRNCSVSSNVRYVTWSHGTDCHAEQPAGRVHYFKMAKIDPVSPLQGTLQWENLQEVRKLELHHMLNISVENE